MKVCWHPKQRVEKTETAYATIYITFCDDCGMWITQKSYPKAQPQAAAPVDGVGEVK